MACDLFWCICNQVIDSKWIHLFCCVHEGEHKTTHDTIKFFWHPLLRMSSSMFCANKHMFSQHHLFSHHDDRYCAYNTWYSHFGRHSHCWFDCANFISWDVSSRGVIVIIVVKTKKVVSYRNRHLESAFILLVIKILGCLH